MTAVEKGRGPVERDGGPTPPDDMPLALAPQEVTQEEIDDALAAAAVPVEVQDIPGLNTIAHSDSPEEWRKVRARRGAISATAITTVMGTNPFQTIVDLWRERMEGFRPTFSRFSQTVMAYGTLAEPELLEEANRFVHPEPHFVLTHGYVDSWEHPGFGCTPDAWRFALGEGETREGGGTVLELAEFKTGSKSWRKTPRSKPVVPPNYRDQVQWQMLVMGARRVLVVYRQVERDRQGNVLKILGHEQIWVERDEKRISQIVDAVRAYLQDEEDLIPPMTFIDTEDRFDDAPEVTKRNALVRDLLADLRAADAVLNTPEVQAAAAKREEALGALKNVMRAEKGRQVLLSEAGYGATLSRSNRTSYNTALLTEKQRERIRTTTTIESLRVTPKQEG